MRHLPLFRGELALVITVLINSFGVVLMLYSGAGISAISSVPYAFSEVLPFFTLGTWTYLFQAVLAALTMGKTIGVIGSWMDRRFTFATGLHLQKAGQVAK